MSLAVAIEATNGIVLGADSRATFGDPRGMTAMIRFKKYIDPVLGRQLQWLDRRR